MPFLFAGHCLDENRRELRRGDTVVPIEPQVFDVLLYMLQNAERVVSKDDLLTSVWNGRVVSESALTSRINAARKAIGDNGDEQRVIRTIARRGYRLIAEVSNGPELQGPASKLPATPSREGCSATSAEARSATAQSPPDIEAAPLQRRGSIAVMPFLDLSGSGGVRGGMSDAFTHDVITRLAKLRSLFVIAQGTVFALHERGVRTGDVGRLLGVEYVAGGTLRWSGRHVAVSVEVSDARTDRIVWAEDFGGVADDTFVILDEIGGKIVSAIASEIETLERNRAILRPPNSLDAWEAYHCGLWHMYRFDKQSNESAQSLFEAAARLDPTFSRAFAGLSFTHWQNAFQGWADRDSEIEHAYAAAGQSLMADDRDPAAHWAMGRALWLRGSSDHALTELQHSVDLSPNFAQGHYSMAFVQSQCGDAIAAIEAADRAMALSPYDPMLSAMLATRARALKRVGRYQEAADWCERAIARPNAHPHILATAYHCFVLAGRREDAERALIMLKRKSPGYSFDDFRRAFGVTSDLEEAYRRAGADLGRSA
jgi:DNA-binding winged helix-turn-helix (wHTH) protein/tetratricopeptide (TPR) repeat protein